MSICVDLQVILDGLIGEGALKSAIMSVEAGISAVETSVEAGISAVETLGEVGISAVEKLVEVNKNIDKQIAEKKQQQKMAAAHRMRSAVAMHKQLTDMCRQVLLQIDANKKSIAETEGWESLKAELQSICSEDIPDDVTDIESLNYFGFAKLDKIVAKQKYLQTLKFAENDSGIYQGASLADLMSDMKTAISVMKIEATNEKDMGVTDPIVLERVELHEKLSDVASKTISALEHVGKMSSETGLSVSGNTWFHSCFNGVDDLIESLYAPSTSNVELKKGIKRLEDILEQYDMFIPSIEKEQKKMSTLYSTYVNVAKCLREPIESIKSFGSSDALKKRLLALEKRLEKNKKCGEIYQALGREGYICYAMEQELKALGYSAYTRSDITKMSKHNPQNAKIGEKKMPFYSWSDHDLTQLYSITSGNSLQVIVHDDGSVTTQAFSDADDKTAKAVQSKQCSALKKVRENLWNNWFIKCDYREKVSSETVISSAEWFGSNENAWKNNADELIEDRRNNKGEERAMQLK